MLCRFVFCEIILPERTTLPAVAFAVHFLFCFCARLCGSPNSLVRQALDDFFPTLPAVFQPFPPCSTLQEKRLLQKYFDEINQDTGKYCFMVDDTLKGLDLGAVETLIVWDNLDINRWACRSIGAGNINEQPFFLLCLWLENPRGCLRTRSFADERFETLDMKEKLVGALVFFFFLFLPK